MRAFEKARKESGHKTREAFESEKTFGSRREYPAAVKGRSDVSGEKEVVEFERCAQRKGDDQFADVTRFRQPIQTRRDADASACAFESRSLLHAKWLSSMGAHEAGEKTTLGRQRARDFPSSR